MKPISDIFLTSTPVIATGEVGTPTTQKATPSYTRVPLDELELTYMNDAIVFNSINKIVQVIMSATHEITAKDPKVLKYFERFTENIGHTGTEVTWDNILSSGFQNQCVFGKAFNENIYNKRGNRIVDWDIVDPIRIDYAKNSSGKIVLDNFGRPVGYFQTLPWGESNDNDNQTLPANVSLPEGEMGARFIEPHILAQFKFFTIGDGFYPLGLVEPIYKTSVRKLNIEGALANAIYRHGFPIIWARLGDLNHQPTPKQIEGMLEKLKNINFKQEIATPYYYDLQILESKKAEKMQDHLDYFKKQEVTGMGVPSAFATGSADGATYATLGNQSAMFQLTLRDLINKTTFSIRKFMFEPICRLEKFKEVPDIKWDIIGTDEIDRKARRIVKYVHEGVLDPEALTEFIKKIEKIE